MAAFGAVFSIIGAIVGAMMQPSPPSPPTPPPPPPPPPPPVMPEPIKPIDSEPTIAPEQVLNEQQSKLRNIKRKQAAQNTVSPTLVDDSSTSPVSYKTLLGE